MLRILGIDSEKLISDAIKQKLKEQNLSFEVLESPDLAGDGLFTEFHPKVVTFSNGRTFKEQLDVSERWDDEGHDYYAFIEKGALHKIRLINHEE